MSTISRRDLLVSCSAFTATAILGMATPAISRANQRPAFSHGVQSGDVNATSGMMWARADRPSQVMFEIATREDLLNSEKLHPLFADPQADFAVKRLVTDLRPIRTFSIAYNFKISAISM
ncbi:MAG: PhoD-like phosphatase N-terminal domain-containing protein [Hyphomicrobiaceae bacterium]